ncbi:MAG: hypothetical protein ACOYMG_30005 [Candidatus Methylumidiphilus sp.]
MLNRVPAFGLGNGKMVGAGNFVRFAKIAGTAKRLDYLGAKKQFRNDEFVLDQLFAVKCQPAGFFHVQKIPVQGIQPLIILAESQGFGLRVTGEFGDGFQPVGITRTQGG